MEIVKFTLNGIEVEFTGNANERLLDVLRDNFNCKSVKCGCKEGECGACAVLIDNILYNSCCVAVASIAGSNIITLEGYRESEKFKVLDEAFAELSAVQCGFCIPGMILAAEALLCQNPNPNEKEIREALSGNLCRCTGYNSIVNAIKIAAKKGEGLW